MLEGNTKGAILVVTYERWHTTTYIGVVGHPEIMTKGIIIITTCVLLLSCGQIANSIFEPMTIPLTNKDISFLQKSLLGYRLTNATWPNQLIDYTSFCDSLQINIPDHFEEIDLNQRNDSLDVKYQLRYLEGDSTKFRFIKGLFTMTLANDSSVSVNYGPQYAERHDGSIWPSDSTSTDKEQLLQNKLNRLKN